MNKKKIFIIVIALILIVAGIIAVLSINKQQEEAARLAEEQRQAEAERQSTVTVVVAATEIPRNVAVTRDMIKTVTVNIDELNGSNYFTTEQAVLGLTSSVIYMEDMVLDPSYFSSAALTGMTEELSSGTAPYNYLAYYIPEDMVAIPIAVNMDTAVAGYIRKGDTVDVVVGVTYQEDEDFNYNSMERDTYGDGLYGYSPLINVYTYEEEESVAAEKFVYHSVVAENIEVVAIGDTLYSYGMGNDNDAITSKGMYTYLVIAASQEDCLKILDAQKNSNITLMLHHKDNDAELREAYDAQKSGSNDEEVVIPVIDEAIIPEDTEVVAPPEETPVLQDDTVSY